MTAAAAGARPGLPTTKLRWVWSALPAAERRKSLDQLQRWMEWLLNEYPSLQTKIPPCWYKHSEGRNRLTALYVGWVRTYVEAAANQHDLSLVAWHDALDRSVERLMFPRRCVSEGVHHPDQHQPWSTDEEFPAWRGSSPEATAEAHHPAPQFARPVRPAAAQNTAAQDAAAAAAPSTQARPDFAAVLTAERVQALVDSGQARQLLPSGPIYYRDHWWIGKRGGMFTRIRSDDPVNAGLDDALERLQMANEATRGRRQADQPDTAATQPGPASGEEDRQQTTRGDPP